MNFTEKQVGDILDIGIMLMKEKDYNHLFELIIEKAMELTNCDAGTLYLWDEHEGCLRFKIMRTISLNIYRGGKGEEIDMPPVPLCEEHVCAYSAMHNKVVNIADVYNSDEFDFSGPKKYDAITGFHTGSMLVIPLEDHDAELIGVLQLLNALDGDGNIIPFHPDYERVILSLASQTAVSISNMSYIKEVKDILYSYAETMAEIVDRRTPYNGNHTRNVVHHVSRFIDFLNREHENGRYEGCFDENRKEQLVMAAQLHDIGKMCVPREIMNKDSRLGTHLEQVVLRYELITHYYWRDFYEHRISEEKRKAECEYLDTALVLIQKINDIPFLTDDLAEEVRELASHSYIKPDGERIPYLTPYEKSCLLIRKGTLTAEERRIMESHVSITSEILSTISFNSHYENVPKWAGAHHEFLDGSGYPDGLCAENMPSDIRILTIADIYEALVAHDRPYKKAKSKEESIAILKQMAGEGKLDKELVELFAGYVRSGADE